MEKALRPLIDPRNADLWEALKKEFHIVLQANGPGYQTEFTLDKVIIHVDQEQIIPAAFTHELLHLYLKSRGIWITVELEEVLEKEELLKDIFSDSLIQHIGNCLEHKKMLPLFLERGFTHREFLRDYDQKIMNDAQLQDLKKRLHSDEAFDPEAVDTYIGKFFSMKASNNKAFDYSRYFGALFDLDQSLYTILDHFWGSWRYFEVGDPSEKYREMLAIFRSGLKNWAEKRGVIHP